MHVGGLIEPLVMVDAEWSDVGSPASRRNCSGTAKLWGEEPCRNTREDEKSGESVEYADWSALISSIAEVTLRSAVVSPGGPTPTLSPFEKIRIL
jgi:hypothetical protein